MIEAIRQSWALLMGVFLLLIGNGVQGTLLGIRGDMEGFSTTELSFVMSAYFLGFLGGSQLAPELIRRVGHVRVFAALASFISAILILYPALTAPWAWIGLRVMFGFCMSGVYVTAESWLNSGSRNDIRGQTLSLYLFVQMAGIIAAQALPAFGDASGFILFVIPSVLVSISFAPILLSISPTPAFEAGRRMPIRELFAVSPLGCVGVFIMGGIYSAIFGMASVYGTQAGLSAREIAIFIAVIYIGGALFLFPVGRLSDRMDRRTMILAGALLGALASLVPVFVPGYTALLIAALIVGGTANPLYGLLIAHTNDFLESDSMASAAGQLLFLNGCAAVIGPILTGMMITAVGPGGFFLFMASLFGALSLYAAYRSTRRPSHPREGASDFTAVQPYSSVIALEVAHDTVADTAEPAPEDEEIEALKP